MAGCNRLYSYCLYLLVKGKIAKIKTKIITEFILTSKNNLSFTAVKYPFDGRLQFSSSFQGYRS